MAKRAAASGILVNDATVMVWRWVVCESRLWQKSKIDALESVWLSVGEKTLRYLVVRFLTRKSCLAKLGCCFMRRRFLCISCIYGFSIYLGWRIITYFRWKLHNETRFKVAVCQDSKNYSLKQMILRGKRALYITERWSITVSVIFEDRGKPVKKGIRGN